MVPLKVQFLLLHLLLGLAMANGVRIAGQTFTFSTEATTWEVAKSRCEALGARLAIVKDPQAFQTYAASHYPDHHYWLGATDIASEGDWIWINGQPLDNFPWPEDEPSQTNPNGMEEDCLEWGHWNQWFNDQICNNTFFYVCEHDWVCDHINDYPGGWVALGKGIKARCYLFSELNGFSTTSQQDAYDNCFRMGGELATAGLYEATEEDPLLTYWKDKKLSRAWIGAKKIGSSWKWSDGRDLSVDSPLWIYDYFDHQMNPSGDGDCSEIIGAGDHAKGAINDLSCTEHKRFFVCQRNASSNPLNRSGLYGDAIRIF